MKRLEEYRHEKRYEILDNHLALRARYLELPRGLSRNWHIHIITRAIEWHIWREFDEEEKALIYDGGPERWMK